MTRYERSYEQLLRRRPVPRPGQMGRIHPCAFCPSADSRDARHQTGCPSLAALSKAQLVAIARNVEEGWAAAGEPAGIAKGGGA